MEYLAELAAELVMWACADKWPRVAAFLIITALIIGAIVYFGKT